MKWNYSNMFAAARVTRANINVEAARHHVIKAWESFNSWQGGGAVNNDDDDDNKGNNGRVSQVAKAARPEMDRKAPS